MCFLVTLGPRTGYSSEKTEVCYNYYIFSQTHIPQISEKYHIVCDQELVSCLTVAISRDQGKAKEIFLCYWHNCK